MLSYIIRRLLLAIPTLIGMTAVVFFIMGLSPGGTAAMLAKDAQLKPQEREAIKKYLEERYGLDKPLIVQYGRWLKKIAPVQIGPGPMGWPWFKEPDLGESFIRSRKVSDLIGDALPVTLLLNLLSLPIIYTLSVLIGGAIIVETIFSVPGMGRLGVESIFYKDRDVVLGVALVAGVLGLTGNLLADICYAIADPRVAYD
jgi:ABC-type dipeptide/oligopeptide/nickel transport system permease component